MTPTQVRRHDYSVCARDGAGRPRSSKGEPFRRARSRGRAFVATVKKGKMAYLDRRIERVGVAHLEAMSDRELEDIGLTWSQRSSRRWEGNDDQALR